LGDVVAGEVGDIAGGVLNSKGYVVTALPAIREVRMDGHMDISM
jgi:hypothetical protein